MTEAAEELLLAEAPDISHIITEDDTPVDNIFSEKQQRLLAESLNTCWKPGRPFVAASNVGIFYAINQPPIVPDMFLSLDVQLADDMWKKRNRSYFVWEFGKPPEVVVEVVSNSKGGETSNKMKLYEHIRVLYYVIFDPQRLIQKEELRVYEFTAKGYIPKIRGELTEIGLSVKLWEGVFEGKNQIWLRWYDSRGNLIPTGAERAEQEYRRAEQERRRAEEAEKKAASAEKNGAQSKALETARRMLDKGFAPDEICEITGLSAPEVEAILPKV